MRDLKSNIQTAAGLSATLSGVTPAVGNIVDLRGFDAAALVLATGTVTDAGTAAGFTIKLQESDTTANADFTDYTDAGTVAVVLDTADDVAVGILGYVGNKRYVRAVATGTTGTAAVINGIWTKGNPSVSPAGGVDANIAAT